MPRSTLPALLALAAAAALAPAPAAAQGASPPGAAASLPAWTRGATCYQVFIRSFQDADGDGTGDLAGLIDRLDYINDGDSATTGDLGARCIWLMPVAQSPSYHGYDVTNYYEVERSYGTNADFERFVDAAHERGIKVLVDLVLNHSSSEHPYFKAALHDTASAYRDWYLWSATRPDYRGPWGQQVWHRSPVRDEYYKGIFIDGMPELNLANPEVTAEARRIARFWLEEMDVDGFRFDAVTHFFEDGANMKHLPRTHAWLRDYAAFIRQVKPDAFTIGEVWDSTGAVLPYYPDQLDSYFAFEVADGIVDAVQTGSPARFTSAVQRMQRDVPEGRWSPFTRNHDQPRLMNVLGGDAAKARQAATLLLTIPGVPFLYYGEEIGMTGDKMGGNQPDYRIRTPMQWNGTRGAGFTESVPWEPLQPDSMSANVAIQEAAPGSLLNRYRRLVQLRDAHPALATGEFVPLQATSDRVAAYLRRAGDRTVLVVANLTNAPLANVALSSADRALAAGRYAPRELLRGDVVAAPSVGGDGRLTRYVPVPVLAPMESYVIDLVPVR